MGPLCGMLSSVPGKVSHRKKKMAQRLPMGASGAVRKSGASGRRHTMQLGQVGVLGSPCTRARCTTSDFAALRLARSKQGQQLAIVMHGRGRLGKGSRQTDLLGMLGPLCVSIVFGCASDNTESVQAHLRR